MVASKWSDAAKLKLDIAHLVNIMSRTNLLSESSDRKFTVSNNLRFTWDMQLSQKSDDVVYVNALPG